MADLSSIDHELSKSTQALKIEGAQELTPQLQGFMSNIIQEAASYNNVLPFDQKGLTVRVGELNGLIGSFTTDTNGKTPSLNIDKNSVSNLDRKLGQNIQIVESTSNELVSSPKDLAQLALRIAHEYKHYDQFLKGKLRPKNVSILGSLLNGNLSTNKPVTGSDYIYNPLEVEARKSSIGFLVYLRDNLTRHENISGIDKLLLAGIDQVVLEEQTKEKEFEERKDDPIFKVNLDVQYGNKMDLQL